MKKFRNASTAKTPATAHGTPRTNKTSNPRMKWVFCSLIYLNRGLHSDLARIGRLYGNVQAQLCLPNTPNTAWPVLMFNISRHFRQREQHKCATAELRTLVELNQDQPCRRLDHIQPTTGSDLRSLQKVVTSRPIRRLPLQVHSKQPIQQESQALMH